ncbi:hypothetical protein WMF30_07385 [Sorangium sp. So ce134]
MNSKTQIEYINAQIAAIDAELQTLTEDDAVERRSLAALRRRLEADVDKLRASIDRCANVVLSFDGGPVFGSGGIDAGFISPAMQHYHGLVRQLAKLRSGKKAISGAKLLMTGVVYGSFGVELQENRLSSVSSALSDAVEEAGHLLDVAARREDEIVEAFDGIDVKAQRSLTRFLAVLRKHKARLKMTSDRSEVTLTTAEISTALARVESIETTEEPGQEIPGLFGGVLGYSRKFEHQTDAGDIIRGIIGDDVDLVKVQEFFGRRCSIVATVTTRKRNNRQWVSYRMTTVPVLIPDASNERRAG